MRDGRLRGGLRRRNRVQLGVQRVHLPARIFQGCGRLLILLRQPFRDIALMDRVSKQPDKYQQGHNQRRKPWHCRRRAGNRSFFLHSFFLISGFESLFQHGKKLLGTSPAVHQSNLRSKCPNFVSC
jgi:hypothetical protein